MQVVCIFCGLFLAIAIVNCSPIVKRDAEEPSQNDLNSINEIYVFEADEATDGEKNNRDKRKIGISLGIKNGILNFIFGKVDALLDSKTKALIVLDEGNKAKNAIYGIDPTKSRTTEFINDLLSKKLQSATSSIGPLISGATTFLSGASAGLTNAVASKFAPLSSLSGGLLGGGDGNGSSGSTLISSLLTQGINVLSSISSQGSNLSGGISGSGQTTSSASDASSSSGGGAFVNLAGYDYTSPQVA